MRDEALFARAGKRRERTPAIRRGARRRPGACWRLSACAGLLAYAACCSVKGALESLAEDDAGDRAEAARDLGECGDQASGLELLAHLEGGRGEKQRAESDPEVIAEGLRSLAVLHRRDPFEAAAQARIRALIDRALTSEVELVRLQAARIAGDFLDQGLQDHIIALLEGRTREILFEARLMLLEALGRAAGDEKTRALWQRIANDAQEDETERAVAQRLLREHAAMNGGAGRAP